MTPDRSNPCNVSVPIHATLDAWIAREAIPFSLDSPEACNSAVDAVATALGDTVALLGFGEALHGGQDLLILRNRLFQRLVEAHGHSAIAIESSFPRARIVNEYVEERGPASYEAMQESGFSHGFGRLEANRELVEWMRRHSADPAHPGKIRFYGFDSPTEFAGADSPRLLLHFALDYLATFVPASGQAIRNRIDSLLGPDADWENPAAMTDPAQSIDLSPAATALRIETEELISELQVRRPELVARDADDRFARLLGIRDAMMADILAAIVSREEDRGKVLAYAHNSHLQRGHARWERGADVIAWWPAGAHLAAMLGPRYAVIGSAVGVSEAHGIDQPEPGTLEERLTAAPGPARFVPTHVGHGLPAAEIAALPVRSGSPRNPGYFPLTSQSFTDFDWLSSTPPPTPPVARPCNRELRNGLFRLLKGTSPWTRL